MYPPNILEDFWRLCRQSQPVDPPLPSAYTAWAFGHTPELADRLGELVRQGIKTATCSLLWEYEAENEALPQPGQISIILNGAGEPLCAIRTLAVEVCPFDQVKAQHAWEEGEGDRSLEYWRAVHWEVAEFTCAQLGRSLQPDLPLVLERFECIYPK